MLARTFGRVAASHTRRQAAPVAHVAVRSMSTEANHKPPTAMFGLHARYAGAFFTAASKGGQLEKVEKELKGLGSLISSTPSLKAYLTNPIIKRQEKKEDMNKITSGYSELTRGLVNVIADNGRLKEMGKVIETFQMMMDQKRGFVKAEITSAQELTKKQVTQVQNAMGRFLEDGQTIKLTTKVDPEILGGLQVQVGDKFIDLSIQGKITKVSQALASA